ncbi:MAG: glutathione S-transferase C-terminal domain-containing protein, partial [Hoeflea sp.]|nr:glutathione S-transferase C-terminal domain-containing protein [Hoeflea sp.]
FERGTKQRYGMGPVDPDEVAEGLQLFHRAALILEAHLASRDWLTGGSPSYADFRMATFLPYNDIAKLPLEEHEAVGRWYARLDALEAWRQPFEGLQIPELPPVPH